ncbi:MAG TPA: RNA-binding cell elongation regulator Jag/EloR [Spirochaetota bacterium]|nr:RNA-binding cell elongation regulator Jag/EloR [Spirochaetota bacterium]
MKVIEVEGKSIDEAVKKAADSLGIHYSKIRESDIEVLDEGKSGIFGFGVSRSAKIRVTYTIEMSDSSEGARGIVKTILEKMGIDAVIRNVNESENKIYIELESENSGLIIGKKGKTLEALQFIVNMMVNTNARAEKKVIIDIESYRAKRERALHKMSQEIADRVVRTGKPYSLEPMNPFERRLVHMALQNHEQVMTKSEGQGAFRKVKVYPRTTQK